MKLKTYFNAALFCLAAGLLAACADDIMGDGNKDKQGKEEVKGVQFSTEKAKMDAPTRVAVSEDGTTHPQTRTYIQHTAGGGADAYWSDNDKIWVKNKNGQWKQSISTDVYDNGRRAVFVLPGDASDYNDNCAVVYANADYNQYYVQTIWPTGATATYPLTHVDYIQDQTTPNDFSKAGERGDCGVGKAKTKDGRKFDFTLEHCVSYLCLQPRTNDFNPDDVKLTKILIDAGTTHLTSDIMEMHEDGTIHYVNDTPGIYDYANPVVWGTVSDFPLRKDGGRPYSPEINACYFVVLPGTHDIKISYTIHDSQFNLDYTFKKDIGSIVCKPGEIYDITSNLAMPYPTYSFWDADYFGSIYYSGGFDGSFLGEDVFLHSPSQDHYNPSGRFDAETEVFKKLPNVNEMMWYANKGDAHWVNEGQGGICNWGGYLHRPAGIWLKKKAAILRDEHITEAYMRDGYPNKNGVYTDFRETLVYAEMPNGITPKTGTPTNVDDYFFLAAAGWYINWGYLFRVNTDGYYWTSSGLPKSKGGYALLFTEQGITVSAFSSSIDNAVPMPFQ